MFRNFLRTQDYPKFTYGNEQMISLNIPKKYLILLEVDWPKISVLTNSILQKIPLNKFKYSEKLDGIHTYLLIFDKKIFNVTNYNNFSIILPIDSINFINMNFSGDCIIETEYYENIYYIFDVYYLNGVDLSNKFLDERLNSIAKYMNDLGPSFKLKKFKEITDLKELLEYIKNDKSPDGNNIDGIILQRIDKPYFQETNEFYCYKFKPSHLNTIDFLLKYNNELNCFDLYLLGDYYHYYMNNLKKLPKQKKIYRLKNITKPVNGKNTFIRDHEKVLIYFDSPFYPNLGTMELSENWNKQDYSSTQINKIAELITKMKRDPQNYNDTIVELSLTNDKKWVPYRIREDKAYPNSYRVGLSNISIIFDKIKPLNDIYFQTCLSMSQEKLNIIHKINQIFRKYIIENYINEFGTNSSIIDLCGGRGADLFNLYSNGVSNFFVIDNDTSALRRYFDRTFNLYKYEYEPLDINNYYYNTPNWMNLNILNHKLDKNYEDIMQDLYSRNEFYKKKVNIVLMNFAFHYLCDDNEKIKKLCEFVLNVLFEEGIFIITYFDGDEIIKKMENNKAKIGPFNIEKIKEENGTIIAKMPLPTIKEGKDFYVEEPLVRKENINILNEYFSKHDEFFVYDRCKKFIDNIEGFTEFIDYYRLIKVGIYCLKNYS